MNESGQISKFWDNLLTQLSKLRSTQIIVIGFLVLILIGSILLTLPIASKDGNSIGFLNALFTATSAGCVTGLIVVNTLSHWTLFGQIVIIMLIQIGGMGFTTLVTIVLVYMGKKITLKDRLLIQESFNQNDFSGMVRLVKKVLFGTILIEGIAAVILAVRFIIEPDIDFITGVGMGLFHGISAFCNAGFDLIGDSSITPYVGDPVINLVIMSLIILGGLGYTVWIDIVRVMRQRNKDLKFVFSMEYKKLALHSKIVLETTALLILFGAVYFFVFEYTNPATMGGLTLSQKIWASFFQSVSPRTAGFNSISQDGMTLGSKIMTVLLMFVGGSPAGTAGGVKTVTLSILILSAVSVVQGKSSIEAHNKSIPFFVLQKALAVLMLNLTVIIVATIILSITESGLSQSFGLIDYVFEVTSAVGTVGITTGITPFLSDMGKITIMLCMFMGRVGPITLAIALGYRSALGKNSIHYPEEKVIVG